MITVGAEADKTAIIEWLFQHSHDLMFVSGPRRVFSLVNPAWERQLGWTEAELIGQPCRDFFHPDGWVDLLAKPDDVTDHETRVLSKEGGWRWYSMRGQMVGDVAIITMRDIAAERTRAAEQEEIRRIRQLLSVAAGVSAWRYDAAEQRINWSPEFLARTGYDGKQIENFAKFSAHIHPADRARSEAVINEAVQTGKGGVIEQRLKVRGRWRSLRSTFHTELGPHGRYILHGISEDITEVARARDTARRGEQQMRRARKVAEAAAEAKSSFLANMSHEIRTPMSGVLGVLHLLKSEPLSPEGRRMLEEALSCGDMLAELVNDVIDFSKIEAGRLELNYEPIDPKALAAGVMRMLQPQADAKGIALQVDADPELGWVNGDPVRLRQALFNLAGNAVKFTPSGSVTLRCAAPARGRLRFEVVDTGVGIPNHAQARVFRRFDQGDVATAKRFGGSGLGLAITRKLAEMMSGAVGFTSRMGEGSTFWLEVAAEPCAAQPGDAAATPQLPPGLRILVVDDNATNRMIASKLLEAMDAEVTTAADGHQAVEAARAGMFDIILMDVQMPGIDGLEAARRIRALPGSVRRAPIIALTANVLAHQRRAYLDAGMDGMVGKPISPPALFNEIARLAKAASAETRSSAA